MEAYFLGALTVSKARQDKLDDEIAAVTGLEHGTVREKLRAAHGNSAVRNIFKGKWPTREEELARLTVSRVREAHDSLLLYDIAHVAAALRLLDGLLVDVMRTAGWEMPG